MHNICTGKVEGKNNIMFDTAIIGSGPAGLSAALNLKLHNKDIIWFGASAMSEKLGKAEKIANYPGIPMISGEAMNEAFSKQTEEMGISVTQKLVTNIVPAKGSFMLLADNEMYEAKSVILCTGAVSAKGIEGEQRLLGRGVSYCATCDGFLYRGKTVAVYCSAKHYEHEVEYLAENAEKLYLYAAYDGCEMDIPNVEQLSSPIVEVLGDAKVTGIALADRSLREVDGVFFMRNAIAPATVLNGLELDGAHIIVDRAMKTSIEGVFAAGDCTGRPYQIAKAVGEGNVAAHSVISYLSEKQ